MRRSTRISTRRGERTPLRFGSYIIRKCLNGGLESALQGMSQANLDLGVFQETKITDGVYTRGSDGYSSVATDVTVQHRGGVAVFYQDSPWFAVEAIHKFGPNVVIFHLSTGGRQWCIIGCYPTPEYDLTIESVITEIREQPQGSKLLVTVYFNVVLAQPEGASREEDI